MHDDDYTVAPTHIRVSEDSGEWSIDGADNDLRYTEEVWTFETFEEATAMIPKFIETLRESGVEWKWDSARPHRSRHVTKASAKAHCEEGQS